VKTNTVVFVLLLLLTCLSFAAAQGAVSAFSRRDLAVPVIVIAFMKVRLVGLHFMEIRAAPRVLRLGFEIWMIAIGSTLLTLFFSGSQR